MTKLLEKLGAKRFVALLIGPGLLAVAIDSAIAHFAGKGVGHPAQLVPLAYGAAAFVVMILVTVVDPQLAWFRRGLRMLGLASAAVGAAGTFFHVKPMLADLADETLSWDAIDGALGVAPPVFAPAAFIALGGLLWVLASPRLQLRIALDAEARRFVDEPAPAPKAEPVDAAGIGPR